MIRITTWSPDTCDCILEYSWDDAEPEESRKHNFHRIVQKCSMHSETGKELYDVVVDENKCKNKVFTLSQSVKPSLDKADYTWAFTDKRTLKASFRNCTPTEKQQIGQLIKTEFKEDKVEIT